MSGQYIAFFILSILTISGAVFMISFTRVIHMVVALAFTFLRISVLFLLLEAEFVGLTQIMVYSGGISVLMLFGIMLTQHSKHERSEQKTGFRIFTFAGVLLFFAAVFYGIQKTPWSQEAVDYSTQNSVKEIGVQMYTNYVIPFELVSVLLLVALIGGIIMAKKEADDE